NDLLLASAELYNPAARMWMATGSMHATRAGHTATLLPSEQVLAVGGSGTPRIAASAELYRPTNERWNPTGYIHPGRVSHTATLLPNGLVLAVGGQLPTGSAELY